MAHSKTKTDDAAVELHRPGAFFQGVRAYFVESGIQPRRLKIWSQKLQQLGATMEDHVSRETTHVFASTIEKLQEKISLQRLKQLKVKALRYEWIQECLKEGRYLPLEQYLLMVESTGRNTLISGESHQEQETFDSKEGASSCSSKKRKKDLDALDWKIDTASSSHREVGGKTNNVEEGGELGDVESIQAKPEDKPGGLSAAESRGFSEKSASGEVSSRSVGSGDSNVGILSPTICIGNEEQGSPSSCYIPPDLNQNITSLFAELKDIYKDALGDDRRSFSYHKAISVLEKLPFKINNVDQVKGLPTIGKSMQENVHEILTTGRLMKLENFKNDERVRTIRLFASVWGIGPVTAQKLYEKGHRTLDDLKTEPSLTAAQRVGLQFRDDISQKIPRDEVKDMEALVKQAAEGIQPGMVVVCGGSYRRGKQFCGDMDIVMTHPDGQSHKGFLRKLVAVLKKMDFLKEDLLFGPDNSIQGTDSGVDTYFGLCKYPGREQRHRIDLKVYPMDIYPFGLIAWTGNDVLNRRLRLLAESKGYKLDDTGLFPVTHDSHGHKVSRKSSTLRCKTETEVFEVLGFPWLEPHERNL